MNATTQILEKLLGTYFLQTRVPDDTQNRKNMSLLYNNTEYFGDIFWPEQSIKFKGLLSASYLHVNRISTNFWYCHRILTQNLILLVIADILEL